MGDAIFCNTDENTFTQAVLEKSTKIEDLFQFLKDSFGEGEYEIKYSDDEGDIITIKSQLELEESFNQAENSEIIFNLNKIEKEEEQEKQEDEKEEKEEQEAKKLEEAKRLEEERI